MSTEHLTKSILDAPQDFIASLLPLYSGPRVKVRIPSASREYELSKAILCKQSPYFAATFEGGFREGQDQSTTLPEIDSMVSPRSFVMLVQWLYLGRVLFSESTPKECITTTIEFVRLADFCGVTGMETQMAQKIQAIILANPAPNTSLVEQGRDPDTNTYSLIPQHITSAFLLPNGHPVRRVLATAAVEGYLRSDKPKFLKEIREIPSFAVDLLMEIKKTLKTATASEFGVSFSFTDPLSGQTLPFVARCP